MRFRDLDLKYSYDSDVDNILEDFYIPILSRSNLYQRIAGYFSSNSLAIAARGLSYFIKNGGRIQLISNVFLSEEDYNQLVKYSQYEVIEQAESQFIEEIDSLEDALVRDHIKMLGWMLSREKLEMKIALVPGGIYHQKVGILYDNQGDIVSFSGSNNETMSGWLGNIEEFHVFCSFRDGDKNHLEADIIKFEKLWSNHAERARVLPVSEAVNLKLIQIAPKDDEEFERLSKKLEDELSTRNKGYLKYMVEERPINIEFIQARRERKGVEPLILRNYQKTAVNNWNRNGLKGIFQMATGTGKTETAIGALSQLITEKKPLFIIIAVNGQSLLSQWISKLDQYGIRAHGASSNPEYKSWERRFREEVVAVNQNYKPFSIIVTTYQTFSSARFIEIAKRLKVDTFLICDEVHNAGAPTFRAGLLQEYSYRLGLSATPERWYDDDGSKHIETYFNKTVFTFSMKDAISTVNPATRRTYLCPYRYFPSIVGLSAEENYEFLRLTNRIVKLVHAKVKSSEQESLLQNLLFKRADIKKNAESKLTELDRIFSQLGESLHHCIIFCSGKQLPRVKESLQKNQRIYHEFTQFQSPQLREELLQLFELGRSEGGYDVLLAIDCLNEGIDLPAARIGIFLNNSQNPIEFIQRRGRLLRPHKDKEEAVFYDFISKPNFTSSDNDHFELERRELQKEFNRLLEFATLAKNSGDALDIMESLIHEYNLVFTCQDMESTL